MPLVVYQVTSAPMGEACRFHDFEWRTTEMRAAGRLLGATTVDVGLAQYAGSQTDRGRCPVCLVGPHRPRPDHDLEVGDQPDDHDQAEHVATQRTARVDRRGMPAYQISVLPHDLPPMSRVGDTIGPADRGEHYSGRLAGQPHGGAQAVALAL
jgi:hypothetical protein